VKWRFLGLLLEPLQYEVEGDFIGELPRHFVLDLLFGDVPPVVIAAFTPLFMSVFE
jgi:hypothetical protein